jgi:hypothetical protein
MPGEENDIVAEHAELIGRVAIAWTDLNHILIHLFQRFSGLPGDKAKAIYFTLKSDSAQRELLNGVAKIALAPHPELWGRFKTCMDKIRSLAGERNAAMHTSWVVSFPGIEFKPSPDMPVHKALQLDFVNQFQSLKENLSKQFFELNEIRKEFEKLPSKTAEFGQFESPFVW